MKETFYPDTRLPAEWEKQDAVILVWPHEATDWRLFLPQIETFYVQLASTISCHERVIIVCRSSALQERIETLLNASPARSERIYYVHAEYNDTWIRDSGPISVYRRGKTVALDFQFNAWGDKYCSHNDNQLTQAIFSDTLLFSSQRESVDWVLEGGGIESDGKGTLMVTRSCLLSQTRNPDFSEHTYLEKLGALMGITRILWLSSGQLTGDDTDGHIDTLARFCNEETIAYVACDDPDDPHYHSLQEMKHELSSLTTQEGTPYKLIPLPMPSPVFNDQGARLPATYANFLIINSAVLVPTYQSPYDEVALKRLHSAFPDRSIIGIDCCAAIEQFGSLHCLTMQLPAGSLHLPTQE